jgi:cytochrome c553
MVATRSAIFSGPMMAALVAVAWLSGCMPAPTDGATGSGTGGDSGGRGGAAGMGGSGGGGAGVPSGAGGSSAGSGGAAGASAGKGGGAGAGQGTGGAGATDGGAPGLTDAAPPPSAIPGYAVCSVCHGPEGAGTVMGPDIQHPVVDFATWMVRNGRMHPSYMLPMPKYPPDQLTDVQLQGILTYMAARPKASSGADLYKDYCQNCHGADAKGGATMRSLAGKPVTKFLTDVRSGHSPGEFANRREYMPKWTPAELSDAEIRLIFMHVSGL